MLRGLACLTVLAALLVAGCGSNDYGEKVAQRTCGLIVPGVAYPDGDSEVWWKFPHGWNVTVTKRGGEWAPTVDGCWRLGG